MEINKIVATQILQMELLSNIGKQYKNYSNFKSMKQVEKSINSVKWENICLEERNKVTGFLAVNFPDEYNKYWNMLVEEIKQNVIPIIEKKLDILLEENRITVLIKQSILFDIVNIIMVRSYEKYIQSDFYDRMLAIYENGHLPCGWEGKYPIGEIKIY